MRAGDGKLPEIVVRSVAHAARYPISLATLGCTLPTQRGLAGSSRPRRVRGSYDDAAQEASSRNLEK